MVGSSLSGADEMRMSTVSRGGSSRVLSNAFCAFWFIACAVTRSATLYFDSSARNARRSCSLRTCPMRMSRDGVLLKSLRPAMPRSTCSASGITHVTSGWLRFATRLHAEHLPQPSNGFSGHTSACASPAAVSSLPTPSGP